MLERHELEAFLTLAQELHFGRTAERLHLSTARVSQTIRKLERRVGAPLFARTSRRVELTAVGRELHDDVRPAWQAIVAAFERAVDQGRGVTGTLRAAFTGAAAGQLLAGVAELFESREPGCEVLIREAHQAQVAQWLRDGEADLVLTTVPVEGADLEAGEALVREASMLAVPVRHPFADRAGVVAADLAGASVLDPLSGTLQELLTLVGAGKGVLKVGAQTRRYHPRPDVAYVQISDVPMLEWALVWRAGGATARVRAFERAARDLLDPPAA